jgi:hypothetical protein
MANTLTRLIPDLYAAARQVSREMVGFIPAVGSNFNDQPAAVGEAIVIPIAPAATAGDVVPAMTPATAGDQTIGNTTVTITKSRSAAFAYTGEEQMGLKNGPGRLTIQAKQIAQAMRTLVNEIETDVAVAAQLGASRAFGTAGTTPFASDLSDTANILQILKDNGSPMGDLQLVINSTAGTKMRTLTQLTKANEAASEDPLRQGVLLDVHGFDIRESAQNVAVTKGTGTSYTSSTAGFAVGVTDIAIITGSGTVVAGDVVTFAGDLNKYVIETGVSAPGTISLQEPGLREAIAASAVAMTIGGDYSANVGFDRDAIQLVTRAPAMPEEGDLRIDTTMITDPVSGLSFEISVWAGARMVKYEVAMAWGVDSVHPNHIATLLG